MLRFWKVTLFGFCFGAIVGCGEEKVKPIEVQAKTEGNPKVGSQNPAKKSKAKRAKPSSEGE